MDYRVYHFTPAMWEILRHLGVYEQLPLQLLLGAAAATPAELIYLSSDEEMIDALDLATNRTVNGAITADRIRENTLWARINSFGQWAEARCNELRPALAYLAASRIHTTVTALTTAVDISDDLLIAMDWAGLIELRRGADADRPRYTHRPGVISQSRLSRGAEWRDGIDVRITTKGRTYTAPW
jgi:hypothetical protein